MKNDEIMKIWMITRNTNKYKEATRILSKYKIKVIQISQEKLEIQSDNIENIAIYSLNNIKNSCKPLVVEDAGIFIEYYKGFPGPYSSYVRRTLGLDGILQLMQGITERKAYYKSVVAYKDGEERKCFIGIVMGQIAYKIRGTTGFGCDPIFIPDEGDGRTFGEMTEGEKNAISHRARAFRSLGEWLTRKHF